jgi:hypothetical protein
MNHVAALNARYRFNGTTAKDRDAAYMREVYSSNLKLQIVLPPLRTFGSIGTQTDLHVERDWVLSSVAPGNEGGARRHMELKADLSAVLLVQSRLATAVTCVADQAAAGTNMPFLIAKMPFGDSPTINAIMLSRGETMALKILMEQKADFWKCDARPFWETVFQPQYMDTHRWNQDGPAHSRAASCVPATITKFMFGIIKAAHVMPQVEKRFLEATILAFGPRGRAPKTATKRSSNEPLTSGTVPATPASTSKGKKPGKFATLIPNNAASMIITILICPQLPSSPAAFPPPRTCYAKRLYVTAPTTRVARKSFPLPT